jgi:hypothetical protein
LPTHYWLSWIDLFRDPIFWHGIERGLLLQAGYLTVFFAASWANFATCALGWHALDVIEGLAGRAGSLRPLSNSTSSVNMPHWPPCGGCLWALGRLRSVQSG